MIYGSVCSGIEAATVAWHPLGWTPAFFSEIEAAPRAVLSHHYPDVPLHGDFTTIGADDYGPIDLLVGGTPCQSFSIAGLRKGLDDDRGNLALEFIKLAQRKRPRWLVWENVPGVLSSNKGRDFGTFLTALGEIGYGFAYRVLDAQYFGVPQRRRRVFVVGCLGDWRSAAAVLFERHSLQGHPAPRREKGQSSSCRPSSRPDRSLFQDSEFGVGEYDSAGSLRAGRIPEHQMVLEGWPADIAPTLNASFGSKMGLEDQHIRGGAECSSVAQCLTTGTGQRYDPETETLIPTHGGGFDVATLDGLDTARTLTRRYDGSPCHDRGPDVVAFAHQQGGSIDLHMSDDCALALQRSQTQAVNYAAAVRRLTPRECERLQGFPDVQKCYTIIICRDLSDQQKANALAAHQCRSAPNNVWTADATGWMLSAEAAAHHSSTSHHDHAPPVAVDVLIDLERQAVRLHSAGRSLSLAASAETKSEFPLPTGIDSFARLAALLTQTWALTTSVGKEGSQANIKPFSPLLSGSSIAISFGRETGEPASDVANAIEAANRLSTSTTLPSGFDTETLPSTLTTLSCCVVRAIAGCIPETTNKANCFAVRLTTTQGYTSVPYRGRTMADGPRYKALGNSMAVPCMLWLGQRIKMVHERRW